MAQRKDGGAAVDAQLVSALADIAHIDGAAFHGGDDRRAVREFDQIHCDALGSHELLVDGGFDSPKAAVIGHIGNVEGNGFDDFGLSGADGQGAGHEQGQQNGKQFFHG